MPSPDLRSLSTTSADQLSVPSIEPPLTKEEVFEGSLRALRDCQQPPERLELLLETFARLVERDGYDRQEFERLARKSVPALAH